MMILLVVRVYAILDPSAVYCDAMGYEFTIKETESGVISACVLSDGTEVNSWDFLKGKIGKEYSYCEKEGYILKTIEDSEKCSSIFSYDCAVCVKDGEEIEVTTLMNLSFDESLCGDGICMLETYYGCPEDCPSGYGDGYCDKVDDGRCDPDCVRGGDSDCPEFIEKIPDNEILTQNMVFYLTLSYKDNKVNLEDLILMKGQLPTIFEPVSGYTANFISFSGNKLYTLKFLFSFSAIGSTKVSFLVLPYFPNAKQIEVYSFEEVLLLTIDISEYALCNEDFNCEIPRENYENCPADCSSGIEDGICDFVEDGICDPDCGERELDCQGIVYTASEIQYLNQEYQKQIDTLNQISANVTDSFEQENIRKQIQSMESRIKEIAEKSFKKRGYLAIASLAFLVLFLVFLISIISVKIFKIIKRKRSRRNVKELEKKEKGIGLKKTELKKDFQKKLKEKEKSLMKKEKFLDRLLFRKKKVHGKEKEVLGKKLEKDKKLLTEKKTEVKKELRKEFEAKESSLESQKIELKKEEKAAKDKIHHEIRELLSVGREQVAYGNKSGARDTYRKLRKLHDSLKSSEKNKELHDSILMFYKRLTK